MRTFVSELQSFICPDEPAGKIVVDYRDVGTGGQREQCLSPYFDRSVNLISTEGGGGVYIMPIPPPPPNFQTFLRPWIRVCSRGVTKASAKTSAFPKGLVNQAN